MPLPVSGASHLGRLLSSRLWRELRVALCRAVGFRLVSDGLALAPLNPALPPQLRHCGALGSGRPLPRHPGAEHPCHPAQAAPDGVRRPARRHRGRALVGTCGHIEVILHDDDSVEATDNGRRLPRGHQTPHRPVRRRHRLHQTPRRRIGGGSYAASGGLHGVGGSVVNALSARLDIEVYRHGRTHAISFRRGTPGTYYTCPGPDAACTPARSLRQTTNPQVADRRPRASPGRPPDSSRTPSSP